MTAVIGFVITILIFCLLFGLLWALVNALPLNDPFKKWAQAAVLVLAIVVVLCFIAGWLPVVPLRYRY